MSTRPGETTRPEMSTQIFRAATRAIRPVALVFSLYMLWRGHDSPGGGFIAALIAGAAVILTYLTEGSAGVRRLLPVRATTLLAVGVLIATGVGIGGAILGEAFLDGTILRQHFPIVGERKFATSLLFDVGVYLVVVGVVVASVRSLGAGDGDEPPPTEGSAG